MTSWLMRALYLHLNFSARVLVKQSWGTHSPLTAEQHRRFLAPFKTRSDRLGTVAFLEALFDRDDPAWSVHASLGAIQKAPTQLIWGARDLIHVATLNRWERLCPHAEVALLADVGHFPAAEAPEVVARYGRAKPFR